LCPNALDIPIGPTAGDRRLLDRYDQRWGSRDCCTAQRRGKNKQRFKKDVKKLMATTIDVSRAAQDLRQWDLTQVSSTQFSWPVGHFQPWHDRVHLRPNKRILKQARFAAKRREEKLEDVTT
jgi:hypothetical protein